MNTVAQARKTSAADPSQDLGYCTFQLGSFGFRRDEYFVHITWTTRDGRPLSHTMDIGNFLRALMRDVAWGFFYGGVNFDDVIGTVNHYKSVDMQAGAFNETMKESGVDLLENFPVDQIRDVFEKMLDDWTNEGFDPFAAPLETGSPYGRKHGNNTAAVTRARELAKRCVGLKDDLKLRSDERGAPVNRSFADVPQNEPELHPEPGFENEVHAFNLFAFLSRSQVTWNPSFTSVVKHSYMCPTTEEHILPILHSNDRVEWFFQMSDEIQWNCSDKNTGKPLARVIMKAGDIAAMPAYCRHQGFSPKRSMLLVWENGSPNLVYEIQKGDAPEIPVQF
ncbi:hydroxyquinol 1,2-dioxygenase [Diaphorobacter caeni]|uniref:hydroxyquinol 1,2-dioxygenase n=1 Tax=Diaphorobacter caeni TaxID=2784387 RepID=UPI0018902DAA|nr:hydroxyquinol 1,2-dioxygenase [Diaphorobacter caeni]MBF5005764.1 hydroxyquinol 1,2-dioxygenase [Diaphorobacter caeni]